MTTSTIKAMIPCNIQKVWGTVSGFKHYHTWRSDVSRTEVTDEKHFTEYTKDGYSTAFTVTVSEPYQRFELDMENSHITGHFVYVFTPKGSETEIDLTAYITAKKLTTRPVGKSVFENVYSKRELERFIADLKKALG